jgi:hypothetical protein
MMNKPSLIRTTVLCCIAALLGSQANAQTLYQEKPQPRLIAVTGDAEIRVVPDQVVVTLGLETSDPIPAKAKAANDARLQGVLAATTKLGVAKTDVAVAYLNFQTRYLKDNIPQFTANRTVVVTLDALNKLEPLLTQLAQTNRANYVRSIEYKTTSLRKNRDEARELAMKAAKEKAVALAGAVGAKVGRPYSITESGGGYSGYSPWGYNPGYAMSNVSINAQVSRSSGEGGELAPDIRVTAHVNVSFELE